MPYAALFDLLQADLLQPCLQVLLQFLITCLLVFLLSQQNVGEFGELDLRLQGGTNGSLLSGPKSLWSSWLQCRDNITKEMG